MRGPMKIRPVPALAACLALFASQADGGAAHADDTASLTPSDFGYVRTIDPTTDDPLQAVVLDAEFYAGAVRADLNDVRVYDGDGRAVPHAVRSLVDQSADSPTVVTLPVFSIPAAKNGPEAASGMTAANQYALDVELSDSGAIVRIDPQSTTRDQEPIGRPAPNGYLVDASQRDRPIAALDFEWIGGGEQFVTPLRISGSDDLIHFVTLNPRAVLARLDQHGHLIERTRVEIAPRGDRDPAHRYLRVDWLGEPLPVRLTGVRGELEPKRSLPTRLEAEFTGRPDPEPAGTFIFDLGGGIPVDRIQVALPEANTVIEARLASADDPAGPWRALYSGLLYRFDRDGGLRNPPIPVSPHRARYIKLEASGKGGGVGAGTPTLEVAWLPEQLLFVTRGSGPFVLAYGRYDAEPGDYDASTLLGITGKEEKDVAPSSAHLGNPRRSAGDAVFEPVEEPISIRTIGLWSLLAVIVAFVLALSVRLARETRTAE